MLNKLLQILFKVNRIKGDIKALSNGTYPKRVVKRTVRKSVNKSVNKCINKLFK